MTISQVKITSYRYRMSSTIKRPTQYELAYLQQFVRVCVRADTYVWVGEDLIKEMGVNPFSVLRFRIMAGKYNS